MSFGGWSFSVTCFNYIREKLAKGQTILELGSGWGTGELSKFYKMYSIENENSFINKYNSTYIHAPIKRYNSEFKAPDIPENIGWYDPDIIKLNLPKNYHYLLSIQYFPEILELKLVLQIQSLMLSFLKKILV